VGGEEGGGWREEVAVEALRSLESYR
jgi:hypothetical protein